MAGQTEPRGVWSPPTSSAGGKPPVTAEAGQCPGGRPPLAGRHLGGAGRPQSGRKLRGKHSGFILRVQPHPHPRAGGRRRAQPSEPRAPRPRRAQRPPYRTHTHPQAQGPNLGSGAVTSNPDGVGEKTPSRPMAMGARGQPACSETGQGPASPRDPASPPQPQGSPSIASAGTLESQGPTLWQQTNRDGTRGCLESDPNPRSQEAPAAQPMPLGPSPISCSPPRQSPGLPVATWSHQGGPGPQLPHLFPTDHPGPAWGKEAGPLRHRLPLPAAA